jgi:MFS transporter, DHA2 family, multidrug resistance protein
MSATAEAASSGGDSKDRQDIHPWVIAPVVAVAAFMEILDISVANVALPHIAGDLSASQDESTWTLTSYLVTNAMVMPISGWLAARFGRKRFFLTCIAGFTITSLLCGLAPSLAVLVILRAIQGACGGGLQPTGQAILNDAFPPEQRSMATAVYAIAAVVAPAIGPSIGGWITDNYEWRWVFLINVPVGAALIFLIGFLVHTPNEGPDKKASHGKVDGLGFMFVALALGCLQVVLDRGQEDDWFADPMITTLCIVSGISFVLLVWWERAQKDPMVDISLLGQREFAISFVLMLFLGFMLLGSTYLLPAYAQQLMGYRATEAGEVIAPGGIILILLFPFVGRLANKVDLRYMIGLGVLISAGALFWMTNFYLQVSFYTLAMGRLMQAVGLAFLFLPINALAFRSVPKERSNYASALINLARNFGGSIGISFASTLVTRREQFHQSRIVEHLQSFNPNYSEYINQAAAVTHNAAGSTAMLAQTYRFGTTQAMLLSYLDSYKAFGVVFLLLIPLLFFVKPGTAAGTSGGGH